MSFSLKLDARKESCIKLINELSKYYKYVSSFQTMKLTEETTTKENYEGPIYLNMKKFNVL